MDQRVTALTDANGGTRSPAPRRTAVRPRTGNAAVAPLAASFIWAWTFAAHAEGAAGAANPTPPAALTMATASAEAQIIFILGILLFAALAYAMHIRQAGQERLRDLADTVSDWLWETDSDLRISYVSERFFELTGLTPATVLGTSLNGRLIDGNGQTIDLKPKRQTRRSQEFFPYRPFRGLELTISDQRGRQRSFELAGKPRYDRIGTFYGYRGTGADITERRLLQQSAAEQAAKLEVAVQAMPNGIIMIDRNLKISVHNRKYMELWDLTPEQMAQHRHLPDMIRFLAERGDYGPGDPAELARKRLERAMSCPSESYNLNLANGRVLEVHSAGRVDIGYVLTFFDVTDRRRAELKVQETAARLKAVIEAMPNGIIVFDQNQEIQLYNERFLDLWDLTDDLIRSRPQLSQLVRYLAERGEYGPGDPEAMTQRRLDQLTHSPELGQEFQRSNGRILEIRGFGSAAVGHILTYLDITERKLAEQTIRVSEQRLREILEHSPVGITIIRSSDRQRLFWNRSLVQMFAGTTDLAITEIGWEPEFVRPRDRSRLLAAMTRGEAVKGCEMEVYRHDGTPSWCLLDMLPIDYWGEPAFIFWVYDITERKRMERELVQSRRFLRAIIDAIPANINVKDRDLSFVLMNSHQAERYGMSPEEVIGRQARDLPSYQTSTSWELRDRAVLASGIALPFYETDVVDQPGQVRRWLTTKLPLRNDRGAVTHVLTVGLDITERKRTELALVQSEERLKLALAVTRAGVWDIDLRNRRRWWTPEIASILGYATDELPTSMRGMLGLVHPEDRKAIHESFRRHLAGVDPEFRVDYRVRHKQSRWVWFHDVGRVMRDPEGRPIRFIGTVVDITERRQTEAELMRSEQMAALGRLVAGVSHEINTPIGLGLGLASYLEERVNRIGTLYRADDMAREDFEEFLAGATESAVALVSNLRRAASLVRSFKQVAVDQTSDEKRLFNVHAYLDEVLLSLGPKLKRTNHQVDIRCPDDLSVNSFPGALSQIVTNLIDNSLVHGFEDMDAGRIVIEVEAVADQMILTYRDNGRGMTAEQTERIFEPFFTTKRGRGGSGLGMHIVYNLVTRTLGGQIACDSAPRRGVVMRVTVPLDKEVGHAELS